MPRDAEASRSLAAGLAMHLPGWHADMGDGRDWAELVRDDGARIAVWVGGYRNENRVTFAGLWPKHRDGSSSYWGKRAEITCRADRAVAALAKEISRRLLPEYDAAYTKVVAETRQNDDSADEAMLVATRVAAAVDGEVRSPRRVSDQVHIGRGPEAVCRLHVSPAYGDTPVRVSFEVHDLPPELALRVLEVIREGEAGGVRLASRVAEVPPGDEVEDETAAPEPDKRRAAAT